MGKSSVVLRFCQNDFQANKEPTIGAWFLLSIVSNLADEPWCAPCRSCLPHPALSIGCVAQAEVWESTRRDADGLLCAEDKVIKFEIWDTAGQERFRSLSPMYYRNAQAAVVSTSPSSSLHVSLTLCC